MQVTIKLFAFLQDRLGPVITVKLADQSVTVDQLFTEVAKRDPTLRPVLANSRLAINQEFFEGEELHLTPEDEVAIIPPVSGG